MNPPLITSNSRLHARNAPSTNSLMLAWLWWVIQESREPAAKGMAQMMLEAKARPNIRLSVIIESLSIALMTYVTNADVPIIAMKMPRAAAMGNPSSVTRGMRRSELESARRTERVENEGSMNRCR